MTFTTLRTPVILPLSAVLLALLVLLTPHGSRASERDCLLACMAQPGTNTITTCAPKCNLTQLDHRCLGSCMAIGTGTYQCRQACSYIKPEALRAAPAHAGNTQFAPIIPIGSDEIAPLAPVSPPKVTTPPKMLSPNVQPLSPSTNYKCVAQCVQAGLENALCTQSCSY